MDTVFNAEGIAFTEVADHHRLLTGIIGHDAVVAGFDAPTAAVTFVFIYKDHTGFLDSPQGFSSAGSDTRWVFA